MLNLQALISSLEHIGNANFPQFGAGYSPSVPTQVGINTFWALAAGAAVTTSAAAASTITQRCFMVASLSSESPTRDSKKTQNENYPACFQQPSQGRFERRQGRYGRYHYIHVEVAWIVVRSPDEQRDIRVWYRTNRHLAAPMRATC
jgi:hypothetical protein